MGKFEKVSGSATALRNGVAVELQLGDPVYKGDVLETFVRSLAPGPC